VAELTNWLTNDCVTDEFVSSVTICPPDVQSESQSLPGKKILVSTGHPS